MSESLRSFIVQSQQSANPGGGYEEEVSSSSSAFMTEITELPHTTTFHLNNLQTTSVTFLKTQPEVSETFLDLATPGTKTFLTASETDVGNGEENISSVGGNGMEEEVATTGSLLYLDPATGLHVLVHHLPHASQEAAEIQVEDGPQEQFVVVGALQSEEDQVVLERPLEEGVVLERSLDEQVVMESSVEEHHSGHNSSVSVDLLTSEMVSPRGNNGPEISAHQIFTSNLESTLDLGVPLQRSGAPTSTHQNDSILELRSSANSVEHHQDNSLMDCSGTTMLTLQVPEGNDVTSGELRRDILSMESVPHINLEEIIERFASTSSQQHHNASETGMNDHIVSTSVNSSEGAASTNGGFSDISVFKSNNFPSVSKLSMGSHISIGPTPSSLQNSEKGSATGGLKSTSRPNITLKLKTRNECSEEKGRSLRNSEPVAVDEESLYDIVMTYRCKLCAEVFLEKAGLLQHYQDIHKPGETVKIRVTTSENSDLQQAMHSKLNKKSPQAHMTVNPESSTPMEKMREDGREKSPKEVNILSCGFCSQEFFCLKECQKHIGKEHPMELKKKGKAVSVQRRTSNKLKTKYPSQPGILIGHRKSRLYSTDESDKQDNTDGSIRRIRTPKNLQDMYWLHKQKPSPVFSNNVEKKLKCSVHGCNRKFSSESRLQLHRKCHGIRDNGEWRAFSCFVCFEKFDKWEICQSHLWKAHELDVDLLTCGICHNYKTSTPLRLLIHQRTHSETKDFICQECGKGFRQQSQLINHEVLHITDPKDLPNWAQKRRCWLCDKWYGDAKTLKNHLASVHMKLKPFSCSNCSYKCSRRFDLTVHQRQHTGERPHKCDLCTWQCQDHNAMRRHKITHLQVKLLKCPHKSCRYETNRAYYFKRHVARKHLQAEAVYHCQVCSLETPNIQDYVKHVATHEKMLVQEAYEKRVNTSKANVNGSESDEQLNENVDNKDANSKDKTDPQHVMKLSETVKDDKSQKVLSHSSNSACSNISPMAVDAQPHELSTVVTESSSLEPLVHMETESLTTDPCAMKEEIKVDQMPLAECADGKASSSVLGVVDGNDNNKTTVISVNGDSALMTLPQVMMSEDGQQYIIGISPNGISASQTSIFTIQATDVDHS